MPLVPGARIGPYEILTPLGAGGMGEVYRARDTRLGRDVAVKTLPDALSGDSERIARLQREAHLLAALNHPHIATIFGIETVDGAHFLVLELVDGESLADVITRGRLPLDQSLAIARQIVDALEAAHDKGIIHRDLKPANVMLTLDGQVKVLDFGLARSVDGDGSTSVTNSPTVSFAATQAGIILGTAPYMSPEQAKGRVADKRSDVWAFGCVLFEMLTGQRAFDGEDVSDILAGILRGEPDWNAFPPEVPPAIRALIRRCIEKDRRTRIPDMSVVRFMMSEAAVVTAAPAAAARSRLPRRTVALIALAGIAVGAGLLAGVMYGLQVWNPPDGPGQMRFAIVPAPTQPLLITPTDRVVAVSPDGKYIVYMSGMIGQSQLVIRPIDQLDGARLAGTDGARQPFFSPDSRWIGFFSGSELKKVAVTGGPPVTLSRFAGAPRGGSWAENDIILFATGTTSGGLLSVAAGGGAPRVISKPDPQRGERDYVLPSVLPGGRTAVFTVTGNTAETSQIAAIDLETGVVTQLIAGGSHAEYVDPGFLVYAIAGTLRAVRFDAKRLKVTTDPVPILDGVVTATATGAADFAITRGGSLLFAPGAAAFTSRRLVWVNRRGQEEPISAPPRSYTNPRLSPDDTRIALDVRDQDQDIWIWHFARQTLQRLTIDAGQDQNPVWTKDARRVVFNSTRGGAPNLYSQAADGTGPIERWTTSSNLQVPFWVSSDALSVLFMEVFPGTGPDLMLLHREIKPRTVPLIQTTFSDALADVSPDGRWLAYQSNEGGPPQIYVRPFPKVDEGRWQISVANGTRPVWGRNGQELFFLDSERGIIAVPVRTAPTFTAGQPTKLFDSGAFVGLAGRPYDVSRDAQRFLIVKDADTGDRSTPAASMVMVLNWVEELKARVPANRTTR